VSGALLPARRNAKAAQRQHRSHTTAALRQHSGSNAVARGLLASEPQRDGLDGQACNSSAASPTLSLTLAWS
jgi:hypothetical protein